MSFSPEKSREQQSPIAEICLIGARRVLDLDPSGQFNPEISEEERRVYGLVTDAIVVADENLGHDVHYAEDLGTIVRAEIKNMRPGILNLPLRMHARLFYNRSVSAGQEFVQESTEGV